MKPTEAPYPPAPSRPAAAAPGLALSVLPADGGRVPHPVRRRVGRAAAGWVPALAVALAAPAWPAGAASPGAALAGAAPGGAAPAGAATARLAPAGAASAGAAPAGAAVAAPSAAAAPPDAGPAASLPEVRVARARAVAATAGLRLPARTEPVEEARLYARVSGTVAERHAELGDRVASGALLLRIAVPELDAQLGTVRAQLAQAEAREALARSKLERSRALVAEQFLSPQALDELQAQAAVARADVAAVRAELARLQTLQGYQQLRAPFAGTVVERAVERGDRVGADGANSSPALFRLARLDALKVLLDVPQAQLAGLQPGRPATLRFAEFPGETFPAKVARLAGRIDPASGAMRVELSLPNPGQRLPAGLRGEAELAPPALARLVAVPAQAVQLRGGQPMVATVDPEGRLRFQPVQVGPAQGREVLLQAGLEPEAVVVLQLNALLKEGSRVKPVPVAPPGAPGTAAVPPGPAAASPPR